MGNRSTEGPAAAAAAAAATPTPLSRAMSTTPTPATDQRRPQIVVRTHGDRDQNRPRAAQDLPVVRLHPAVEAAGRAPPCAGVGGVSEVNVFGGAEDGVRLI